MYKYDVKTAGPFAFDACQKLSMAMASDPLTHALMCIKPQYYWPAVAAQYVCIAFAASTIISQTTEATVMEHIDSFRGRSSVVTSEEAVKTRTDVEEQLANKGLLPCDGE